MQKLTWQQGNMKDYGMQRNQGGTNYGGVQGPDCGLRKRARQVYLDLRRICRCHQIILQAENGA